jgi:16S rRNA (uracil1498-N3)-methyltransferase
MRRRFFVERFECGAAALHGEPADHLGRVLRAEPDQLYELSDGQRVWLAKVERVRLAKGGQSRVEFSLLEPLPAAEPRFEIDLLLSIVKFDRFEWCLEKATELGVTRIVALAAARTDKSLLAAAGNRQRRWKRILVEAAQQSRRLRPPTLGDVSRPQTAFAESSVSLKIIFSERRDRPPLRDVLSSAAATSAAALAIGPEGGWTEAEIAAARSAGFAEASLGEHILRTETAVLAAVAILSFAMAH